jgi:hypothetical protein
LFGHEEGSPVRSKDMLSHHRTAYDLPV